MKKILMVLIGAAIILPSCNDAGEEPTDQFISQNETSRYLDSVKAANTSARVKDDQSHWGGK